MNESIIDKIKNNFNESSKIKKPEYPLGNKDIGNINFEGKNIFSLSNIDGKVVSIIKRSQYKNVNQGKVTIEGLEGSKLIESDLRELELEENKLAYSLGSTEDRYKKILISMNNVAHSYPKIIRYNKQIITALIKHLGLHETQSIKNNNYVKVEPKLKNESYDILHIGITSSGKTTYILEHMYGKNKNVFSSLSSIKESTNFKIVHLSNYLNGLCDDEFEVHIQFKTLDEIKNNIDNIIVEALENLFEAISEGLDNKTQDKNDYINNIVESYKNKLTLNNSKTFNLSYIVDDSDLDTIVNILLEVWLNILGNSKNNYFDKDKQIEVLSEIIQKNMVSYEIKNTILDSIFISSTYIEFKENILDKLLDNIELFESKCKETDGIAICYLDDEESRDIKPLKIKTTYKMKSETGFKESKELIKYIFGSKADRNKYKDKYKSLENLVREAAIYSNHSERNFRERHFDGVGFNQGQNKSIDTVKNIVSTQIIDTKPSFIIYHTSIVSKDDYMVRVVNNICDSGYKDKIFIAIGKFDIILPNVLEELEIDGNEIDEYNAETIRNHIMKEYIETDLMNMPKFNKNLIKVVDKKGKLNKEYVYRDIFKDQLVYDHMNFVINQVQQLKENEKSKKTSILFQGSLKKIVEFFEKSQVGNVIAEYFINDIDKMIPLNYSDLRWNTLECALSRMVYYDLGFDCVDPLAYIYGYARDILNCEEVVTILGDYKDIYTKIFLEELTYIMQTSFMSGYKFEYEVMLKSRHNYDLRIMKNETLTNERKIGLRNIFIGNMINKGTTITEIFIDISNKIGEMINDLK